MKVSEIGVSVFGQPLPVVTECQKPWGSTMDPVKIARYAAPTLSNVMLSAWGMPSQL